ncbi:hypothetical protein AB8O64_19660 [Streptomyces sp. QH1-20]
MTAVAVEITTRPPAPVQPEPEPAGVVIVANVEDLADGSAPGCGNDNPYQ